MNFQTYLQTVRQRAAPMDSPAQLEHAQIGMVTELGELGDLLKRKLAYGKAFDSVNLLEECGDYLWYFVLYCDEKRIHMGVLEDELAKCERRTSETEVKASNAKLFRVLALSTGVLVADDIAEAEPAQVLQTVESALGLVYELLKRHGYTVAQCLVANDAKLELRNRGKAFDREATLNRDHGAERTVLEAHAAGQPDPAAG